MAMRWLSPALAAISNAGLCDRGLVRFRSLHRHAEQEPVRFLRMIPPAFIGTGAAVHASLSPWHLAAQVGRNAQPHLCCTCKDG